jgi:predicted Zn-dependent protease
MWPYPGVLDRFGLLEKMMGPLPGRSKWRAPGAVGKVVAAAGVIILVAGAGLGVRGHFAAWVEARTARQEFSAGRYQAAEKAVARWLVAAPQAAEAHLLKAQLALRNGDLGTADTELAHASRLGCDASPQQRLRGLILARSNQPGDAEPLLRQALDSLPGPDPEVAKALARIYLGSFQLMKASRVLDRWSRDAPGDPLPYLWRTEIDSRTEAEPEVAIGHFRDALARDPFLHEARFGLAESLRNSHRNVEAAKEYAVYLEQRSDDSLGYVGAGRNALELGDEAGAVRYLDRALQLAPEDPVALGERALVDFRRADFSSALDRLNRAVAIDPFDPELFYRRSQTLDQLGRRQGAKADRDAVVRLGKDRARFQEIRRHLVRSPNDLSAKCEVARWMVEHGHVEEGVDWARLVLREQPSEPGMNRLLAQYYRTRGNLGMANFYMARAGSQTNQTEAQP